MIEVKGKNGKSYLIRRLTSNDVNEARTYLREFSKETIFTNQYPGQPEKKDEDFIKAYESEHEIYLGTFYREKLIGVCSLRIERPNHPWAKNAVFGIGFLKEHCHQGLGTVLMNELIKKARELNIHRIEGTVRTLNLPAVNLYLKCGFIIEGHKREVVKINDIWYDEYIIAKLLG